MGDVKTGFMHKCGKSVKSWKRRWFVLKPNGYLYYYENKGSKQEKGKIDVVDASKVGVWKEMSGVEKKLPSGFSCDNAFGITVNDRTFTMVCENDGDCASWLDIIKKVRDSGGNFAYPEPTYPKEDKTEAVSQPPPAIEKKEVPVSNQALSPYTSEDKYSQSLPRSGSVHVPATDPGPNFSTMPRPRSAIHPNRSSDASAMPPPLPSSNPYYTPEVAAKAQGSAPPQSSGPPPSNPNYQPAAPPPANPNYQPAAPPPANPNYRPAAPPQQQYRQAPPQPQYRQAPPQPQYRQAPPQPQYRQAPPQPQYHAPPPRPQYPRPANPAYYPPPPQPQYRAPPPQPQYPYRPPSQPQYRPAAAYQPPVRQARPQYRPPVQYQAPRQVQTNVNKTTVTVVTTVRR